MVDVCVGDLCDALYGVCNMFVSLLCRLCKGMNCGVIICGWCLPMCQLSMCIWSVLYISMCFDISRLAKMHGKRLPLELSYLGWYLFV